MNPNCVNAMKYPMNACAKYTSPNISTPSVLNRNGMRTSGTM